MTKAELVSYLTGLHVLLDAQSKGQGSLPSHTLATEYEKHWKILKETIQKETTDEARKSDAHLQREDRTDLSRGQPQGSGPDRSTRTEASPIHGEGSSSPKG